LINRIGHINIRTPLLEETLSFYEKLMDLKRGEAMTMSDQVNNAWLYDKDGRAVIHVNATDADEAVPAIGSRGRIHHVAFDVADFDKTEQRLKDMGLLYQRYDIELVPGLTLLVTQDPNGINLELAHGADLCQNQAFAH
jgi:catechol 2,3-dioxygenase-like lactoylglutathione lyase family enzyme